MCVCDHVTDFYLRFQNTKIKTEKTSDSHSHSHSHSRIEQQSASEVLKWKNGYLHTKIYLRKGFPKVISKGTSLKLNFIHIAMQATYQVHTFCYQVAALKISTATYRVSTAVVSAVSAVTDINSFRPPYENRYQNRKQKNENRRFP